MKFQLCFCLKRNRASYNISARKLSFTNSNAITPTVTSEPLPLPTSDLSIKPNYENTIDSLGNGQISVSDEHPTPTTKTIEYNGYTNITSRQSLPASFKDDRELYATVDKTKQAKNAIRIKADSNRPVSMTITSSQPISSANSHLSEFLTIPEHLTRSLSVYTNHYTKNSDRRRSRYDDVKPRESLPDHAESFQIEEDQTHPNLSVNSERKTTNSSDLYAELDNGSASGTMYPNRPSNSSGIDDDLSTGYATIDDVNNTKDQSTPNNIF